MLHKGNHLYHFSMLAVLWKFILFLATPANMIDQSFFLCLQPAKVKAFIDRVISIPLHDIAIPLSGFRWEFNKVTFY